jgi:hypothetical protein
MMRNVAARPGFGVCYVARAEIDITVRVTRCAAATHEAANTSTLLRVLR